MYSLTRRSPYIGKYNKFIGTPFSLRQSKDVAKSRISFFL